MILRILEIDFIYNKTLMRNCPSETNSKEASWNLNSPMSKLWEIKKNSWSYRMGFFLSKSGKKKSFTAY